MSLSVIGSSFVRPRQPPVKFSPGLPHNQTCGCWRAGNQSIIDVSLNASWVVSGLAFVYTDRAHWLKRFLLEASADNITFLDWGTYTQSNFSTASTVLFRYPIRAVFFRLTVLEYVNHLINNTDGFPLQVNALVSNSEPFICECASLSTGECCPLANMEVKNNVCVMCMDPSGIHTVMVDGCGRCKPGTRPANASAVKCVPVVRSTVGANISLEVSGAVSNGDTWKAWVDVGNSTPRVVLFLCGPSPLTVPPIIRSVGAYLSSLLSQENPIIPIMWNMDIYADDVIGIAPQTNPQYLQFDRGRLALELHESIIRSTSGCENRAECTWNLGALFITSGSGFADVIMRRLTFDMTRARERSLVCGFARRSIPLSVEIHHSMDTDLYQLVLNPAGNTSLIQWDDGPLLALGEDGALAQAPPAAWSSLRVIMGDQRYHVHPPIPVVKRHSLLGMRFARQSVWTRIEYGFGMRPVPEPGDSEQLVTVSAMSRTPVRLVRLASVAVGSGVTVYTSSKGFISDPRRALDLVVACSGMMSIESIVAWLELALGLMGGGAGIRRFAEQTCDRVGRKEVSKLYWLVPLRPIGTGRQERVEARVEVDFA